MICNRKTEVYSRVVGYYRPVQQWNKGKQEEYAQRRVYQLALGVHEPLPRNLLAAEEPKAKVVELNVNSAG